MCKICKQVEKHLQVDLIPLMELKFEIYNSTFYIIRFTDTGDYSDYLEITHCPFCGKRLPKKKIQKRLGLKNV